MDYRQITENPVDAHPEITIRQRIEKVATKYREQNKPFCERCAKIDWRELARNKSIGIATKELTQGFVDFELEGIIPKNLEVYGNSSRFVWEKDTKEAFTLRNNPGVKEVVTFRSYVCTERGCGISLEFSEAQMKNLKDEVYDWTNKNKKDAMDKRQAVNRKTVENLRKEGKKSKEELEAFYKKTQLF